MCVCVYPAPPPSGVCAVQLVLNVEVVAAAALAQQYPTFSFSSPHLLAYRLGHACRRS